MEGAAMIETVVINGRAPGWRHGALKRYQAGCRCGLCRAVKSAAQRRGNVRRASRLASFTGEHGLSAYANHGCRCQVCRVAKSRANAAYRLRVAWGLP
jgi:hypothetical protein